MISIGEPIVISHGMTIHNIKSNQKPIQIILEDVIIPFPPSVYGGESNDELKQSLSISISEESYNIIQKLNEQILNELSNIYPDIAKKWCSCLTPTMEPYEALLKTQIFVKQCIYYNREGDPLHKPDNWRNLKTDVVIVISGVYVSMQQAGLLIRLTHLQYDPSQQLATNPFALSKELEYDPILVCS